MKTLSKIILASVILLLSFYKSIAQTEDTKLSYPVAYLNFNGEKIGNDKHNIIYNTSFFIRNISKSTEANSSVSKVNSMDDKTKTEHMNNVLKSKFGFTVFKLDDAYDNNLKDLEMMVTIKVTATDIADLNVKIKFLLTELGVEHVKYNNKFVSLKEFSF